MKRLGCDRLRKHQLHYVCQLTDQMVTVMREPHLPHIYCCKWSPVHSCSLLREILIGKLSSTDSCREWPLNSSLDELVFLATSPNTAIFPLFLRGNIYCKSEYFFFCCLFLVGTNPLRQVLIFLKPLQLIFPFPPC